MKTNYIQDQIKRVKDYTPVIILTLVTAFTSFSFGFFSNYVKADDNLAENCIKETSLTWNQLDLLKTDIADNLTKTIKSIQDDLSEKNKQRRESLGL